MVLVNNRELKDRSFFEGTEDKRQNYNVRFPGKIFLIFRRQGQDLNRLAVRAFECMTSNQNKVNFAKWCKILESLENVCIEIQTS